VAMVIVVVVVIGGRASDAVDDSTGVAIEEETAGEEGVAAAAAPNPNPNRARGGRETSFSFSFAGLDDGCLTGARIGDTRAGSTMDVIGLIGTLLGAPVTAVATALDCMTLGPLAAAGREVFGRLGVGVGASVGVTVLETEPALAPALETAVSATSAHIAATAVTRPPRPPRADLKSYFTSSTWEGGGYMCASR
jgi:hypothetical protein